MANSTAKKSTDVTVRPEGGAVATIDPARSGKLVERIAARFSVDSDKMLETLKATAFRQRPQKEGKQQVVVTNEHMMMLLVIAEQYHLNPFTRELYAFPQDGGIVPIISVDGWTRLMNEHPQLAWFELNLAPEGTSQEDFYVECVIKRKDREKPITVREYLKECYRQTDPWDSHPRRMLRHKALVQGIRVAFGFAGVFDPDEGERIYAAAIDVTPRGPSGKPETRAPQAKSTAPAADVPALISLDQQNVIADKLKEEGVALSLLLAKFQVGSIEELPASEFDAAIAAIDAASAGT